MSEVKTFRFYNYYDAHLFAHQLEGEGHRAEVYDFVYSTASWPTFEYRVIAFEDGLSGDPEEGETGPQFGEFEQGASAAAIDDFLRILTASGICLVPFLGLYIAVKSKLRLPTASLEFFATIVLCCAVLVASMVASVAVYRGYRCGELWAMVFVQLAGWLLVLAFVGLLDFILVLMIMVLDQLGMIGRLV